MKHWTRAGAEGMIFQHDQNANQGHLGPGPHLAEDRQADLARIALHIEAQEARLAPEDEETKAAIAEGLAQAKQRKFASDARVKATWRQFGL